MGACGVGGAVAIEMSRCAGLINTAKSFTQHYAVHIGHVERGAPYAKHGNRSPIRGSAALNEPAAISRMTYSEREQLIISFSV